MEKRDVIVIGGGPAGLAAAIAADKAGSRVLLIERENRLGGILKQCIHDGFGLVRFGEKLSGPEYAEIFIEELQERKIEFMISSFVTDIKKEGKNFIVSAVNSRGITEYQTKALVLSTGCRERTARQVFIHGDRPAGIFTAGTAQHYTNLLGELPTRKCVILGSGDIGLIMARRLTLEGAQVLGVYEVKQTPSGLTRNIVQCLEDYDIPLYLSHTVTRAFGRERLRAVEIAKVDASMRPIPGTEFIVECDALILSVGLIPENEIAKKLGVVMDKGAKGPVCDTRFMTNVEGVFSCGNALHVNDLVDYVSESGELAGRYAAEYAADSKAAEQPAKGRTAEYGARGNKTALAIKKDPSFLYMTPGKISAGDLKRKIILYFRAAEIMENAELSMLVDGKAVYTKRYLHLRPPEMERLELDPGKYGITANSAVAFTIRKRTKQEAGA